MIDAESKKALYVNEAYETITGRSCESLRDNPTSYEELIHPEDRTHVLAKLEEATRTGQFNERFRIVSTHGEVHWVPVHGKATLALTQDFTWISLWMRYSALSKS